MEEAPAPITQEEVECICRGRLPRRALEGLQFFNAGQYFEAHEALEDAWRAEPGYIRNLYRGVLQVGVGYYHLLKGNYTGTRKMFQRARRWLEPFPAVCRGIDVAQLKVDYQQVEAEVIRLGPDQIQSFNPGLLKPVIYTIPSEETL